MFRWKMVELSELPEPSTFQEESKENTPDEAVQGKDGVFVEDPTI